MSEEKTELIESIEHYSLEEETLKQVEEEKLRRQEIISELQTEKGTVVSLLKELRISENCLTAEKCNQILDAADSISESPINELDFESCVDVEICDALDTTFYNICHFHLLIQKLLRLRAELNRKLARLKKQANTRRALEASDFFEVEDTIFSVEKTRFEKRISGLTELIDSCSEGLGTIFRKSEVQMQEFAAVCGKPLGDSATAQTDSKEEPEEKPAFEFNGPGFFQDLEWNFHSSQLSSGVIQHCRQMKAESEKIFDAIKQLMHIDGQLNVEETQIQELSELHQHLLLQASENAFLKMDEGLESNDSLKQSAYPAGGRSCGGGSGSGSGSGGDESTEGEYSSSDELEAVRRVDRSLLSRLPSDKGSELLKNQQELEKLQSRLARIQIESHLDLSLADSQAQDELSTIQSRLETEAERLRTDIEEAEYKHLLLHGLLWRKFCARKEGKAAVRFVWVTQDFSRIQWRPPTKKLDQHKKISRHRFLRVADIARVSSYTDEKGEHILQFHTAARTLTLQWLRTDTLSSPDNSSPNTSQWTKWVSAFHYLLSLNSQSSSLPEKK